MLENKFEGQGRGVTSRLAGVILVAFALSLLAAAQSGNATITQPFSPPQDPLRSGHTTTCGLIKPAVSRLQKTPLIAAIFWREFGIPPKWRRQRSRRGMFWTPVNSPRRAFTGKDKTSKRTPLRMLRLRREKPGSLF